MRCCCSAAAAVVVLPLFIFDILQPVLHLTQSWAQTTLPPHDAMRALTSCLVFQLQPMYVSQPPDTAAAAFYISEQGIQPRHSPAAPLHQGLAVC